MTRRLWWIALLIGIAGSAGWLISTLRQASRGLDAATTEVAHDGQFPFRVVTLDRPAPAGFESISSPSQFSDVALFEGKFYVCGSTGLMVFDSKGGLTAEYHPGLELPPAPLTRMVAAVGPSGLGTQLWLATHGEGLLVFDGKSFRQIRPEAANARSFSDVLPLETGRILLGSGKQGVLVWDGKSLSQLHPSLAGLKVTALAGSETDLWIGTVDQGAYRWHAGQLDQYSEAEGLPDARVLSLAVTPDAAYIGTALGVAEFKDGRLTRALAPGVFAKTMLVRGENLMVGTLEDGVVEVALAAKQPRPRSSAKTEKSAPVSRLIELDGQLLTLTEEGLYAGRQRLFEPPGAHLTDRNISAIDVDRSGKIWVGYFDRGLDVLDANLEHRTHYEDEHLFCVNRIVHDGDLGITATGTANGLVMFDANGKQRQVLTKAEGLIANNVTDVLIKAAGREARLTVATPAGLTIIDGSGTSSLYAFQGLVNNHVYALAAADSRLLVGTLGGLSMLDAGVVRANYTTANSGLKQNWITAIQPVGPDWFVGTYGAGVIRLDAAGRWTTFPDLKGHIEINSNAMAATPRAIYAGTLGRGLAVFNRASERWSFISNGLPSGNVTALTAAGTYLYIGTENGLVRIPEQQITIQ